MTMLDRCTTCGKQPCHTYAVRDETRIVEATRPNHSHYCHACALEVVARNEQATTGTPPPVERDWRIARTYKSKSSDERHEIRVSLTTGESWCTCKGYTYGAHCWHMDRYIEQEAP